MWLTILNLLNYIGVITNGFIIAITSSFGRKYQQQTVYNVIVGSTTSVNGTSSIVTTTKYVDTLQNLWIIIVFQVRHSTFFQILGKIPRGGGGG